jgi:hypoxanthine phosphoribosyltransferase
MTLTMGREVQIFVEECYATHQETWYIDSAGVAKFKEGSRTEDDCSKMFPGGVPARAGARAAAKAGWVSYVHGRAAVSQRRATGSRGAPARDGNAPNPESRTLEITQLLERVCPEQRRFVQDEIMFTEREIRDAAGKMGADISKYYRDILSPGEHLVIVGLLKGAVPFMTDLVSRITVPTLLDYIAVHSYEGTETTGSVNFRCDMMIDPRGKHVLVVDDIIDTGGTLAWCKKHLAEKSPASVRIACMLDKKERRTADVEADFVGFDIPNKFVVGYGLDFQQAYRTLPFIAVLSPAAYKK